jgi:hypothetical protein
MIVAVQPESKETSLRIGLNFRKVARNERDSKHARIHGGESRKDPQGPCFCLFEKVLEFVFWVLAADFSVCLTAILTFSGSPTFSEIGSKENKRFIERRKEIVKHFFCTIKKHLFFMDFMLRVIEKVKAEFSFICFIYNLKWVLNTIGYCGF